MRNYKLSMSRLFMIDTKLRQRRYPNCATLAREYEVSQKTIQRDIAYMRDQLGAPIAYDASRHGYYYTSDAFFLPYLSFTEQEMLSFVINQRILSQYQDTPLYDEIKQVIDKVLQFIPDAAELGNQANFLTFATMPATAVEQKKFKLLQQAICEERQIKLQYYAASSNETSERQVDPYNIHQYSGAWYLLGYCHKRDDFRLFALNRIFAIELLDDTFYKPADFNIEQVMGDSFHIIRGGKTYHVVLKFTPYQARWIRERQWHRSQRLTEHTDGSVILEMDVQGLDDVRRWVLQYGAEVEVLEPDVLRRQIMTELEKMKAVYAN